MGDEVEHDFFEFALGHLPVTDADAQFGHDRLQPIGDLPDVFDAVVHEEHLAVAIQFSLERASENL